MRALFGGSVREGIGHNTALASPLQSIVADRRSRLDGGLDVAGFDDAPLFRRVVAPHTGETIRLQFNANLQLVALGLIQSKLSLLHLRQDAEQVLHVMANLMGDHVRLRELARFASDVAAAEPAFEIVKKLVSR